MSQSLEDHGSEVGSLDSLDEYNHDINASSSFRAKEEHSKQMLRVLHSRLEALVKATDSTKTETRRHDQDALLGTQSSDTIGHLSQQQLATSDEKSVLDSATQGENPLNSLAYRNQHTPHTKAEKRLESLFAEETQASDYKQVLKRSKSSRVFSTDDLFDRERRRKKLKALQSAAEHMSTKFLSRAPSSVVFRVSQKVSISHDEFNPTLFLDMSLQMIHHQGTRQDIEKLALHETSKDLLMQTFWLCHVQFFQKMAFKEQTYLHNKMSTLYPEVIRVITQADTEHKRDILFRTYPLILAKATYLAFVYLFPGGAGQFQGSFQCVLSHSIFRLLTGVDIGKDSVDSLRQTLYHDQFEPQAKPVISAKTNQNSTDIDLPRKQQRMYVDAYRITPLLRKYIGGDIPVSNRTMLKRTLPSDHCQVGGVCTFRPVSVALKEEPCDQERKIIQLKSRIKKKALALNEIESLHTEQQELLNGTRKARNTFAGDLLIRRHRQ